MLENTVTTKEFDEFEKLMKSKASKHDIEQTNTQLTQFKSDSEIRENNTIREIKLSFNELNNGLESIKKWVTDEL